MPVRADRSAGSGAPASGIPTTTVSVAQAPVSVITPRATSVPGATSALGIRTPSAALRGQASRPGRLPGPLNDIITAASVPAYLVGNIIRHPLDSRTWTASGLDYYHDPKLHTLPGQALRQQHLLDWVPTKYGLRTGVAFAGDIALDPTTYISGGAGVSAHALEASATRAAAIKVIEDSIKANGSATLEHVARAQAAEALAKIGLKPTVRLNFRVPFTRGKEVPIFETRGFHAVGAAAKKGIDKLPGTDTLGGGVDILGQILRTDRKLHPVVNEVYQGLRRYAGALERDNKHASAELNKLITDVAHEAGIKPRLANEAIAKWLDNPEKYQLPAGLEKAGAAAQARRDAIYAQDVQAGIFKGSDAPPVEHYFPHIADSAAGQRAYRKWRGQQSTDKLYDPWYVQSRTAQNLDEFANNGVKHGFKPELNVAKALEVRGTVSIRARQARALDETLKDLMGVKPPPKSTAEAAAKVAKLRQAAAEARAKVDHLVQPRPTAALQAEAAAARERVTQARAELAAAEKTGNHNAVRAAQYRLAVAERKSAGAVRHVASVQASTAVPRFRELIASAAATEARLPKPRAGKYLTDLPLKKISSRLRRFARKTSAEAKQLRDSVAADIRAEAKARRASYKPSSTKNYGRMRDRRLGNTKGRQLSTRTNEGGGDSNPYAFNPGNENSGVHYRTKAEGGGRKTLADYGNDYLTELQDQVDRYGVSSLPEKDRRVYEAVTQAQELENIVYEINNAFEHASGGAFGELNREQGLQRLMDLADSLVGTTAYTDMRAKRLRAAGGLPEARGNVAVSERAQQQMERYFTGPGNTLREQAAAVEQSATHEVQAAIAAADKKVAKAKRAVEKAQKEPSAPVRRAARQRLVRAQAEARQARLTLERARAGYEGTPRQVLAAFRSSVKADAKLAKAEQKLGMLERENLLLSLKPGRPTTPAEWADIRQAWGLVGTGKKDVRGVALPPDVQASLDEVHALIQPILKDDAMHVAGRFIAGFTSRWKILALLTPGYHVRNQIDDGIRAFMAGARNPRSFSQAARILKGGIHEASDTATIRIGKNVYTHRQYLERARAYGVIDAGFVRTEVLSSGESEIAKSRFGLHSPGRGRLARASSNVGNYRENVNRLGTFIELEKAGKSPLVAARRTREFLIDYGEVGRFVDGARKFVFPFITYPSKVIPIYARELARHPAYFAHFGAATDTLNQAAGNPDLSQLQFYNRSAFALPLPGIVKSVLGIPHTPLVNPNGLLGIGSLDLLDPRLSATRSNIFGSLMSPFLRVPVETYTHKSLYFGTELPRLSTAPGFIQFAHNLGVPIPTYVPPGGNASEKGKVDFLKRPVPGYSSYLNELLTMLPAYSQAGRVTTGDSSSRLNAAVKLLLGIPISDYDIARQQGYAATHKR